MSTIPKINVVNGNIIQADDIKNIIDALDGTTAYDLILSGSLVVKGNPVISGSVTVLGDLSFVSSSVLYNSGSNKFGDTLDDTHQFTGSVFISGSDFTRNGYAIIDSSVTSSMTVLSSSYAVSASYAVSSSQAISASFATSASQAISASYAANIPSGKIAIYDSSGFPTFYATLQSAIDDAFSGESIILYSDVEEDITVNKSITIVGNGHKIVAVSTQECVIVNGGVKARILNTYIYSSSATQGCLKILGSSELDLTGSVVESTTLTCINVTDGKVFGGLSYGGIVLVSSGATLENHKHFGTVGTYGISIAGTVRNCIIQGSGRVAANIQTAGLISENNIFISDLQAATINNGNIFNCIFLSTGNIACSLTGAGSSFVATFKDCKFITSYNNAAGHAVNILNTNTAKFRILDCYFETVNASAYGVNASNAQSMTIIGGKFNTTLSINSNITNDIRTADAQGNIFVN